MAALDLDASGDFFRRLADAPLFEHLGEPIEDPSIETARTWKATRAAEAKITWSNASTRGMNYLAAKLIAGVGMDWFQKNYNSTVEAMYKQMHRSLKLRVGKLAREGDCPDYFR